MMDQDQLDRITRLPKVELHLHHEGAAPPDFIKGLAQEKSVNLDGVFAPDGSYAFRDFVHFLNVYEAATQVLKTPEDYARLTKAILEESAANDVIYSEIFLSPDFCGGGDVGAWREYLHAIQEAAAEAEQDHGILLRGIVTCVRHFGPEQAKTAALCAAETAGDWIVGFGMGGNEAKGTAKDFAYSFDMAREAGLRLTAHAGEWGGARSVQDALTDLRVERIGHGVQAITDPALIDRIMDDGIVLELCPGSNVALQVYPTLDQHPIEQLRQRGVKITVSTDDPPFFHTTLRDEYRNLAQTFGWDEDVFMDLNTTAAQAAFCDEDTRRRVLQRLERT
ncbi:adenosine deaminase [Marivita sp. S0852]|uniref:adenosine deaminase n=1 Tax=Marivita sp. S0852 TaxID=3373893 RepID=UPI003982D220